MDTQKPSVFGISKTQRVVGGMHQYEKRFKEVDAWIQR
jgi:metal-dependent hydrolase (beta-lactamase superfamily II)